MHQMTPQPAAGPRPVATPIRPSTAAASQPETEPKTAP
jgi:hypothetical protein